MEPGNSTAPSPPHPAPASHRSSISSSFNNVVVLISNSKTLVNNMAPISDSLKTLTSNLIQTTSKAVHELSTSQSITLNPTNNNQATFNPDHLPWSHIKDDDIEQQEIKTQILGLAGDQRNFLVAPPPTSDFTFTPDDEHWTQQAVALLSVDSNLQKMR